VLACLPPPHNPWIPTLRRRAAAGLCSRCRTSISNSFARQSKPGGLMPSRRRAKPMWRAPGTAFFSAGPMCRLSRKGGPRTLERRVSEDAVPDGGPMVRIHLPPALSRQQTRPGSIPAACASHSARISTGTRFTASGVSLWDPAMKAEARRPGAMNDADACVRYRPPRALAGDLSRSRALHRRGSVGL
jgi:hypothetical protein